MNDIGYELVSDNTKEIIWRHSIGIEIVLDLRYKFISKTFLTTKGVRALLTIPELKALNNELIKRGII